MFFFSDILIDELGELGKEIESLGDPVDLDKVLQDAMSINFPTLEEGDSDEQLMRPGSDGRHPISQLTNDTPFTADDNVSNNNDTAGAAAMKTVVGVSLQGEILVKILWQRVARHCCKSISFLVKLK